MEYLDPLVPFSFNRFKLLLCYNKHIANGKYFIHC